MATSSGSDPRRRVLIVDDEPSVVAVVSRQLEALGFAWTSAGNAEEALSLLDSSRVDIVLMDVDLPGMTGFQALGRVVEVSQAAVVLMSGDTSEESRKDALLLGAKAMLLKPFAAEDLAACLAALGSPPPASAP